MTGYRAFQCVRRNGGQRTVRGDVGLNYSAAISTNQECPKHAAAARLAGHEFRETGAVEAIELPVAFEVVGHRHRLTLQIAGILEHIGLGDVDRRADDRLRPQRKPAIEADVERDAGKNRDKNRRRDRHDRKQRNDAHVKARGGAAFASGA
ncbi:hypothetical protein D9M70_451150 [compost metagenome]